MSKPRRKKIYSYEMGDAVERQIPGLILKAMERLGWNAFGIYEIVRDEIVKEQLARRRLRRETECQKKK